jgi:molybdopterin-guanine dinucleotide biosynthesis protein A
VTATRPQDTTTGDPVLLGVVLAGGLSSRMGSDKGGLVFQGQALVSRAMMTLRPFVESVHVSVRRAQSFRAPYGGLPMLVDAEGVAGPAAGLLAAWEAHPAASLLVLAVDMPLVDPATLAHLVKHRISARLATAYRHPDGTPEPLCAIWEARAATALRGAADPSLRRILETSDVAWLEPPDPSRLVSLNTPEAFAAAESEESTSSR